MKTFQYIGFDNEHSKFVDCGDDVPDVPTENDEGDGGPNPIDLVIEHLFWALHGATKVTISRKNDLSEYVVQACVDELVEEGSVEESRLTLQSDVLGENKFDGFTLTSDFREDVARQYEEIEAQFAIDMGEEEIDP